MTANNEKKKTLEPVAHIAEDGSLHTMEEHLFGVAGLAKEFAAEFGCGEWGQLAGLWHDLGKYSNDFQHYIHAVNAIDANIEAKPGRVNHSTAGGIHAINTFGKLGRIFAYLIAGHHAGLPDWPSEHSGNASLAHRLEKKELLELAKEGGIPADILNLSLPKEKPKPGTGLSLSLWLRMLYSCLTDADFLDTERFFDKEKAADRGNYSSLPELLPHFDRYMAEKIMAAKETSLNGIRRQILERCRFMADSKPGIFTLTVPTGGGKTLSSMAFALDHAVKYQKRRIIYVIPYTSIIEQTADEFRKIFHEAVLEHHSNLDVTDEKKENSRSRLACENWDAPIVVTTSVQFFESLFASRSSRCRKLHNIVNSVVILDEAQLLPPDFLNPILETLDELQRNYGVTLVLSTATQPALKPRKSADFEFKGLPSTIEIMENPDELYRLLNRVEVICSDELLKPQSWEEIAERLLENASVLCIVNRRDDARALWELMPEGTVHLSALMCGAHRSEIITKIKERLKSGEAIRVISTQLVEAGVDLDFPVVYRAMAGLDSIAQAAGRCNREGKPEKGKVFVFTPPSVTPAGHLRQAAEIGRQLLEKRQKMKADPLAPEAFEEFFRELYWTKEKRLDSKNILPDLVNDSEFRLSFREAARKFQLIDQAYGTVVVWHGEGERLTRLLESGKTDRSTLRRLQRYVVNLPQRVHSQLLSAEAIREVCPGIFVQGHKALYDDKLGFCPEKSIIYEPDDLIH